MPSAADERRIHSRIASLIIQFSQPAWPTHELGGGLVAPLVSASAFQAPGAAMRSQFRVHLLLGRPIDELLGNQMTQ